MSLKSDIVRSLESIITEECKLHERYTTILIEERKAISFFKTDIVDSCRQKRELLLDAMQTAHNKRAALTKQITPSGTKPKLGELVQQLGSADDKKRLLPLIKRLRELVNKERRQTIEGASVTQYALNLVHGAFSILWSATQNVTRSYTRFGAVEEKYQALRAATLKKA